MTRSTTVLLAGTLILSLISATLASPTPHCYGHHKVKDHETCSSLASRYDLSVKDFVALNRETFLDKKVDCAKRRNLPKGLIVCNGGYRIVHLDTPLVPTSNASRKAIDRTFASLSFETTVAHRYIGTPSDLNYYTIQLLQNIKDRTGESPVVRVGGSSADMFIFNRTACRNHAQEMDLDDEVYWVGPALFHSMESISDMLGTKWVYGLNLGRNNLKNTIEGAIEAVTILKRSLLAFEIGNEPSAFPDKGHRSKDPKKWNMDVYLNEYNEWSNAIMDGLKALDDSNAPKVSKFSQFFAAQSKKKRVPECTKYHTKNTLNEVHVTHDHGGSLSDPIIGTDFSYNIFQAGSVCCSWHPQDLIDKGLFKLSSNQTQSVSDHLYFGSSCRFQPLSRLLNHTFVKEKVNRRFGTAIKLALDAGKDFIVGETNSLACGGEEGVSDTFGAALFAIDYMFLGASMNIRRMHFHNGGSTKYNVVWYGHRGPSDKHPPDTSQPIYYAFLFFAEAIGKRDTRIEEIITESKSISAYALFEEDKLVRVAVINRDIKNAKGPAPVYHSVTIKAPRDAKHAVTKVLTAPNAYEEDKIWWGGLTMLGSVNGTVLGREHTTEGDVKDGEFVLKIMPSSAVLVSFR